MSTLKKIEKTFKVENDQKVQNKQELDSISKKFHHSSVKKGLDQVSYVIEKMQPKKVSDNFDDDLAQILLEFLQRVNNELNMASSEEIVVDKQEKEIILEENNKLKQENERLRLLLQRSRY